ncbi:MAG: MFS transporter, partial [Pseudomonadota bacterium]
TPVAIAVIADMFPKERRELPTSIYMAVGVLMGSGAFILGGFAVDAAEYVSPMISMDVWRTTLILVGLPGLLLALFAVFLIGPAKQQGASAKTVVSAEEALAYLRGDGLFFLLLFICIGFVSMLAMGLVSWAPTMLIREFGFEVSEAGFAFGSVGMPAAVLGTVLAPIVAKSLSGRFGHSSTPLVIGACSLIGSTLLVLGLASGSTLFLLIGVAGMMLFLSGAIVMPAIVIQILSPPPLRARLMAMNLLCLGLIGQGIGPVIVARIGEVRGGEGGLSFGLMITAMLSATLAISFAWLMHRRLNAPETQQSLAAASEAPSV